MRKKKYIEAYKEGMDAGSKPFENKFKQLKEQQEEIGQKAERILQEQRKQKNLTDNLIEEMERTDFTQKMLADELKENQKKVSTHTTKLNKLEVMIPTITHHCKMCGKPINVHQLVCCNCGNLCDIFPYNLQQFDIEEQCYSGVKKLSETIVQNMDVKVECLYPELKEKFAKMKKIQEIAKQGIQQQEDGNKNIYKQVNRKINSFFERRTEEKMEIAVIGTVKAGKSSLINAIVGSNIASVKATPETSVLVKYRTTDSDNYLKIKFYTEKEWIKLWDSAQNAATFIEEYRKTDAENVKYKFLGKKPKTIPCERDSLHDIVMEWTRSDSPKHFFVKEIEVGYESDDFPHDIFLVDTPGLSDPVKYRSDITRKYISKSDWVLACITSDNLSQQPEFVFLSKVIANKNGDVSKIFVVSTKKDMLLEEERTLKRDEFLKRLTQLYNNNQDLATSRFLFVSAECHTFAKMIKYGEIFSDDERKKMRKILADMDMGFEDLTDSNKLRTVFNYAEVDSLLDKLNNVVIKRRREHLYSKAVQDYNNTMKDINALVGNYIDDKKEILEQFNQENKNQLEQIEDLKIANHEIKIIQEQIKILKEDLEIQIKARQDL